MPPYPIFLDLAGAACVVVGGGEVAERRTAALLDVGARVSVVAPRATLALRAWATEGRIRLASRPYASGDLRGARLAFVATDDDAVNDQVARDARTAGIWVNTADDLPRCDFMVPSVLRRGELVVAVGTGGASPALARAVRLRLEDHLGPEYAEVARLAAEVRRELRSRGLRPDPAAWQRALGGDLSQLVATGDGAEARARLVARLTAPCP